MQDEQKSSATSCYRSNSRSNMAKVVIAGSANCPYYAKAELLGDSLQKNLPDFKLHKIVKDPKDWSSWLEDTCAQHGWSHHRSPLIWRELVDRGGKGVLIGGANEFQEYAHSYYDIRSDFTGNDMTKIATENLQTTVELQEEEAAYRAQSTPLRVCISNAGSGIAYSMVADIAQGGALGSNTEIALTLLDAEKNLGALKAVQMEAIDLACPLLRDVAITSSTEQAFTDCAVIILLDELEKGSEESREEYFKRNHQHFVNYARVIDEVAKQDVKVLLSGQGPVNFNCQTMIEACSTVSRYNIVAVPRLVENHAKAILAEKLQVNSAGIVDVIIWGNVNSTLFVDVSGARVHGYDGAIWGPPSFSLPVTEMVHDEKWTQTQFLQKLKGRLQQVEGALTHRAARSQAAALITLLSHWWNGSNSKQIFSLGVYSDGLYGIPQGMVFSVPVTFALKGYWSIVQDIDLTDENKQKVHDIIQELKGEQEIIYPPPQPPTPEVQDTQESENDNNPASSEADATIGNTETEALMEDIHEEVEEDPMLATSLRKIEEDKEGEQAAQQASDEEVKQPAAED